MGCIPLLRQAHGAGTSGHSRIELVFSCSYSYCGFRGKTGAFRPRCEAKLLLDWCVGLDAREGPEGGFEKGSQTGGPHARAE